MCGRLKRKTVTEIQNIKLDSVDKNITEINIKTAPGYEGE